METKFQVFSTGHLLIIAAVPLLAAALALIQRSFKPDPRWLRLGLAGVLILDTAIWYIDQGLRGALSFPESLPLELCDATLFLMMAALIVKSPAIFDITYYTALAGATMALLTPNVNDPLPASGTVQFFIAHGLVVVSVLFLVWSGQERPRPGSVLRAMLAVNAYAAFVGLVDWIFKTNFMYLCAKPARASLLSLLGPWPLYLVVTEGVALCLFLLLYLPFWISAQESNERGLAA